MHRMRHYVAAIGLISGSMALAATPARADLIRPDAKPAFPDIAADVTGRIEYNYDEATETGVFTMTNTPLAIFGGTSNDSVFGFDLSPDRIGTQTLRLKVDKTGQILDDPLNKYELTGHIEANGQVFSGTLLQGTPTKFGSLDLGPALKASDPIAMSLPTLGLDVFDAEIAIEGGELARFFGPTAYLEITPKLESTFEGSFTEDFTGLKATSNTRGYDSPEPFPIPEPSAIAVLLAGGAGLLIRRRRRRAG